MPRTPDAYLLIVATGTDADLLDHAEQITRELGHPVTGRDDRARIRTVRRTAGAFDVLLEVTGTPEEIATLAVDLQADDRVAQTLTLPCVH